MLDVSHTVKTKSDQLNADDLVAGDLMVQIEGVNVANDPQQPVHIFYYGCEGKPFKPCLTVRKILVSLWGKDANLWAGRWLNLYVDKTVSYGSQKNIGGIRVNAMSHIQNAATLTLAVRRGAKQEFRIQPINLEG
jgi:hypothetical protein